MPPPEKKKICEEACGVVKERHRRKRRIWKEDWTAKKDDYSEGEDE